MIRYVLISVVSGILFWILDGIVNANPYAQKVYSVYKSNMKAAINLSKSFFIYLLYGFAMAGIYLLLNKSLPGGTGILKGLSFGVIVWFFRGFMGVMSQWILYSIPAQTLVYIALSGLAESLVLGALLGLTLKT